jgi:hypothetical protein
MILAYTYYDVDSNVLKGFALELLELLPKKQQYQLLKPRKTSTAANIQKVLLSTPDAPFFFFGHGKQTPGSLIGQDERNAIDQTNLKLLENRLVFAVATPIRNGPRRRSKISTRRRPGRRPPRSG